MSESQSRYSIVERLTIRKIELMSSKARLKEELKTKEQKINEMNKDLFNWKNDVQEDIKREERAKIRFIENAQCEYQNAKQRQSEKETTFEEQMKAIEKALSSIEEISKTTQTS